MNHAITVADIVHIGLAAGAILFVLAVVIVAINVLMPRED